MAGIVCDDLECILFEGNIIYYIGLTQKSLVLWFECPGKLMTPTLTSNVMELKGEALRQEGKAF